MSIPDSEKTFVFSLRLGDKQAFEQLYCRYCRALSGVINGIIKDPVEAQDLLHDTYLKAWQRFGSYDPQRGGVFNWLLNIARNTALDAIRRRKLVYVTAYPETDRLPTTMSGWPVTDTIDVERIVRQRLKPQQWQVIELAYWYGYTRQEIADQLALPVGTVKTRIHQSLIRLRPLFDIASEKKRCL